MNLPNEDFIICNLHQIVTFIRSTGL
jgi:hypothetical protein